MVARETRRRLRPREDGADLPTIVAALIEHDLDATVVARASAGNPVVLANEAARFLAPHAEVGEPLGS